MSALKYPRFAWLGGLLLLTLSLPAAAWNSNKSIYVGDGMQTDGHSTVNGSITVGRSAIVSGGVETVNGTISIDDGAQIRDAETVNGSIRLGSGVMADDISSVNGSIRLSDNVQLEGGISVVNGKITSGTGTRISRGISNVNGEIALEGTDVGGDLSTVNGDVTLDTGSVLRGDLVIEKPGGWGWNRKQSRKPRVVIGPDAQVLGKIHLEREVELYIHERASVSEVSGKMSLADAVRFSGDRP